MKEGSRELIIAKVTVQRTALSGQGLHPPESTAGAVGNWNEPVMEVLLQVKHY